MVSCLHIPRSMSDVDGVGTAGVFVTTGIFIASNVVGTTGVFIASEVCQFLALFFDLSLTFLLTLTPSDGTMALSSTFVQVIFKCWFRSSSNVSSGHIKMLVQVDFFWAAIVVHELNLWSSRVSAFSVSSEASAFSRSSGVSQKSPVLSIGFWRT